MTWNPVKLVQDWLDRRREQEAARKARETLSKPDAER